MAETYRLPLADLVDLDAEYNGSHADWTDADRPEAWTGEQVTARIAQIHADLATWTADCLPGWGFRDGTFTIPQSTDHAANREMALLLVVGMLVHGEAKPVTATGTNPRPCGGCKSGQHRYGSCR